MTMQSIQKPIRMGAQADWGELNTVRDVLNTLGLYDGQARGPMLDRELTDSIKTFQRGHGLKVDGIINPAGETENALFHVTTGHPSPRFEQTRSTRKSSREGIGFGGHPSGIIVKDDTPQTPKPARKPPQKNLFTADIPKPKDKPLLFHLKTEDLDFLTSGRSELSTAIRDPFNAFKVKNIAEQTKKDINKMYPGIKNKADNHVDAARHALWSYRLTKELGAEVAKKFTDAHERHPHAKKPSILMDLENNRIGRILAQNPKNYARSDIDVIKEAIEKGLLRLKPYPVRDE